jgi:hypothetical protein
MVCYRQMVSQYHHIGIGSKKSQIISFRYWVFCLALLLLQCQTITLFSMSTEELNNVRQALDMKVLLNHIYEYQKGVRQMVLFTCNAKYENFATTRLQHQNIEYIIQKAGNTTINIYFGRKQCLDAIRMIVDRPLSQLSPEEDFIIGALLGYDICCQCERFCEKKQRQMKEYA